ncbi:MAG: DUF421 domain-containing protein [Clostridia bacterium]|nr:DUF421 domain-containing protein [Oscillospiraceae bacterium]MBQ7033984.1 DUF421 domain-containing protein [Clostridia bacterium]
MIISFIRTIILYFAVIVSMRIMGKRQIGEMQPFELVVTLMLSDLAAVPMQETGIPLLAGLVPVCTLLVLEVVLSFISMKSKRARAFLLGRPAIIIRGGKLDRAEMQRLRINIDDIEDELRKKDIKSVDEVEIAILETDGNISAFPKSDNASLPYTFISDGRIIEENLGKCGVSKKQLRKMLGAVRPEDVFLATYTRDGGLTVQKK